MIIVGLLHCLIRLFLSKQKKTKEKHDQLMLLIYMQVARLGATENSRILRCTDLVDESVTGHLVPMTDYPDAPLVTLEESMQPVSHFFLPSIRMCGLVKQIHQVQQMV